MKTDIHPEYTDTTVKCSCGNTFVDQVDGEWRPHGRALQRVPPFYTGKQKLVDSGGRVERFNRRYGQRKNAPATPDED